jgi:hypothetical protein
MKDKEFNTLDILAISCALYRTVGFISQARASETGSSSTADMIAYAVYSDIAPEWYAKVDVIDADVAQATDIIKFYRRLTFKVLNNTANEFETRILSIIDATEVTHKSFKMIACVPNSYQKDLQYNNAISLINETSGKLIEPINSKITTFCYIVESRQISSTRFGSEVFYGHTAITTDGCLVEFLNKDSLGSIDSTIKIQANVKDYKSHFKTGKPLTQLNYVKLI